MSRTSIVYSALKVGVTLLILLVLLRSAGLSDVWGHLRTLNKSHLALLLGLTWAGQLLCAQRWRRLASALGLQASYKEAVRLYFIGMLFNIGLPSLIGGDVIKAYLLGRKPGGDFPRAVASVVQDRAAGLLTLLAYGTVGGIIHPLQWRGIPLWILYAGAWAGILLLVALVAGSGRPQTRGAATSMSAVIPRLPAAVSEFRRALKTMKWSRTTALQVGIISGINSALVLWIYQQVTVALRDTVDLAAFTGLYPLIALVTLIPISLGGLGVREWAYVEALAVVGLPADVALSIALTSSALIIAVNLAGGVFLPGLPSDWREAARVR